MDPEDDGVFQGVHWFQYIGADLMYATAGRATPGPGAVV